MKQMLPAETAVKILQSALSKGGTYADIFYEDSTGESIAMQNDTVNQVNIDADHGIGIRVVAGDKTGYAYTESCDINSLLHAAQTAAMIANAPQSHTAQTIKPKKASLRLYEQKIAWESYSIAKKVDYLKYIHATLHELSPNIVRTTISISNQTRKVLFYNSLGDTYVDERPLASIAITAVMQKDGRLESMRKGYAYRMGAEFLEQLDIPAICRELVADLELLFEAGKPKGGEMPVVMGCGSSGILLHEAIGHSFEADCNRTGLSIFADKLGKTICNPAINIVDDGTIANNRGSINFDDEGVVGQKTYLVKDGVLNSYIHDRISANHYGVEPTGNGRRESFRCFPIPRMRTTYMEAGTAKEEDLIKEVKYGVYVSDFSNGQVQIGAGDFTFFVKSGYIIEDGKLTKPIKDINIIGNGPQALKDITAVADNFKIDNSTWMCGKEGQRVPVGLGMPSVLVKKLIVGGI